MAVLLKPHVSHLSSKHRLGYRVDTIAQDEWDVFEGGLPDLISTIAAYVYILCTMVVKLMKNVEHVLFVQDGEKSLQLATQDISFA